MAEVEAQRLQPFVCAQCGAPVPVPDSDRVACPSCSTSLEIPEPYRKARALLRDADRELRAAADDWRRFDRATISPWLTVPVILLAPVLLLVGQTVMAFKIGDSADRALIARQLAEFVWLPSLPLLVLGLWARFLGATATHADFARSALSALPPAEPGKPAGCRACGAPLDILPNTLLVRCLYCHVDSLTSFSDSTGKILEAEKARGAIDVKRAVAMLSQRATLMQGAPLIAVVLATPFLGIMSWWAFGDSSWLREPDYEDFAIIAAILLNIVVVGLTVVYAGFRANDFVDEKREFSTLTGMLWTGALFALCAMVYFDERLVHWVAQGFRY